ncbi:hypothetical protein Agub_g15134, partial [Astrephomene gubernaculifera]
LSLARPAGSAAAAAAAAAAARAEGAGAGPARMEVAGEEEEDGMSSGQPRAEWQARGLGSSLMRGTVAMLQSGRCTEVVRSTVLDVLDGVLGCGEGLLRRVLLPWLGEVLRALHAVIAEAWQQGGAGAGRGGRGFRRRAPSSTAHRELAILERLGGQVGDAALAAQLADSLVALLGQAGSRAVKHRSSGGRSSSSAGRLDEGGIARALGALAALWGRLQPGELAEQAVERHCEAMSMWAIRLTGREPRAQLAAAYSSVARLLPRMAPTAALLADLTAWSPASLDELDYDKRMAAYGSLTAAAWGGMDRLQALPLLLTGLYDLRNAADLALRQAAAAALANFVDALAEAEAQAAAADGGSKEDPPNSLLRLTGRVLYPQLKTQLGCPALAVRQEHLTLLRALAVRLPGRFPDLAVLLSEEAETDFFNNIAHLQSHRRTRALNKLTKLIKSQGQQGQQQPAQATTPTTTTPTTTTTTTTPTTTTTTTTTTPASPPLGRCLMDVIVPLLQQFIEEGAGGGRADVGRAHEKKQTDLDREANVTDAAITTLGAVAGVLPWPQYEQLLNQMMRLMRARPAKPHIRAVCAVLDNFHFALPETDEEAAAAAGAAGAGGEKAGSAAAGGVQQQPRSQAVAAASATAAGQEGGDDKSQKATGEGEAGADGGGSEDGEEGGGGEEEEAAAVAPYDAAAVQRSLLRRILPALHEQLVERKRGDDEEAASVRAPVALALVKLLKLLPPAAERAELPRALQGVANLLRSRIQRVRDDSRAVLVSMMAELGPRYLPYACHVLRASLPDRGFTAHVIGFTLHAVLEAVVKVAHGESAAAAAAAAVAEPAEGAAAPSGYDIEKDEDEEGGGGGGERVQEEEAEGPVGVLDESLELCLPLVEADLFGEVSEAKEVSAFASQHKEAKRCRANEAFQLLASGITFSSHMRPLLTVVTDRLHLAGHPTTRAKLTQLLQFAARGVRANPTAGPKQIMTFVVGVMEGCLTREEAARERAKAAVGPAGSTG